MRVNYDSMIEQIADLLKIGMKQEALQLSIILAKLEAADLMWRETPEKGIIKGFSELHDYCDANELGGMCCVLITETFEDDEKWMDFAAEVQNAVDGAIKRNEIQPTEIEFVMGQGLLTD